MSFLAPQQLLQFHNNGQVFSLRSLPGAESWLQTSKFKSPINACSWMKSARTSKEKVIIYHYRKENDFWTCKVCKNSIPNYQAECCRRRIPARQVDSDFDTGSDDSLRVATAKHNVEVNQSSVEDKEKSAKSYKKKVVCGSNRSVMRKRKYQCTAPSSINEHSNQLNESNLGSISRLPTTIQIKRKRPCIDDNIEDKGDEGLKICGNIDDRKSSTAISSNNNESNETSDSSRSTDNHDSDSELAEDLRKISEMEAEEESKELARCVAMIEKACNDADSFSMSIGSRFISSSSGSSSRSSSTY